MEVYFNAKISNGREASKDLQGFQNLGGLRLISQRFSNFFNSYTKAINKKYNRKGSLFTPNFKRKEINTEEYLRQVVLYVHLNPLLHGVKEDYEHYTYSSYQSILSKNKTVLKRKMVIDLFEDISNFIFMHQKRKLDEELLKGIIEEE